MSDGVIHDLWILSIGIDNKPWGKYQLLISNRKNVIKSKICLNKGKLFNFSTLYKQADN